MSGKQSCIVCKTVLPVFEIILSVFRIIFSVLKLVLPVLKKLLKIVLPVYGVLFTIFYFNLDTKLFYRVMPILNKYHYDVMPAKDFAESIKGRNN